MRAKLAIPLIILAPIFTEGCSLSNPQTENKIPLETANIFFPEIAEQHKLEKDFSVDLTFSNINKETKETTVLDKISVANDGNFVVNGEVIKNNPTGNRIIANVVRRGLNRIYLQKAFSNSDKKIETTKEK